MRMRSSAPSAAFLGGLEQAELFGKLGPSCSASTRRFTFDRAFGEIAEREGPERHADQPIDGQAEMLGEALHLAVLAFTQSQREPEIGALLAVDPRLDRAVMHAVDRDALAQRSSASWLTRPCARTR